MMDEAGHVGRGLPPNGSDFWPWLSLSRNVSAVTGACLGIRKAVFERLGRFEAGFPNNYNDVDLCLRAVQAGLAVIYESGALLRHKEAVTRVPGTSFDERELFHQRWSELVSSGDPYYSPLLRSDTENPELCFAPEVLCETHPPAEDPNVQHEIIGFEGHAKLNSERNKNGERGHRPS